MDVRSKVSRALPTLALAALAGALALASTAVADPIVTVPPTDVAGSDISGSVASDPQADACIGDQHSGADPSDSGIVGLNDSSCSSGAGASGTGGGGTGASPQSGAGSTSTSSGADAKAGATVAAADAVGLRITRVRKVLKNVTLRRNFRLLVTVRDTGNRRVRGAIVSAGRVPGSTTTLSGLHAGFSDKRGVATILVPVTRRMFGKTVFVKIAARTPKARAVALRSVALPALR